MKVMVYNMKQYDKKYLQHVNDTYGFELEFFGPLLTARIAKTANGCEAVYIFVDDDGGHLVLEELKVHGVKHIVLRCVGFNDTDLEVVEEFGLRVIHVPAYSPEAAARHAIGMTISLNRHIHRAHQHTRDTNFSFEGLIGFIMYGKTAGVTSTGRIGVAILRILRGFGMHLLAFNPYPSAVTLELGVGYVDLVILYREPNVISLYCSLTDENYRLLNHEVFNRMKDGVMVTNISRDALTDFQAVIDALKHQRTGMLGLDAYGSERDLFFEGRSNDMIQDNVFRRPSTYHNVLLTGHQAFLTAEALINISGTTLDNLQQTANGETCPNTIV